MPNIGSSGIIGRGDLQFLSHKEFDGKIRTNEGTLTASGTLCTLTANTGKDMYIVRAKISMRATGSDFNAIVELRLDGTVIETYRTGYLVGIGNAMQYEFVNMGQKVLAGEIIVLEATVFGGAGTEDIEGTLECFEEDTGASPDA